MKKIILGISFLSLLFACAPQPDCNNEEAKKLVLDILDENIQKGFIYNIMAEQFGLNRNQIDDKRVQANKFLFFKGGDADLSAVRTTSKDEKLKFCSCEGEFTFSEEAYDKLYKELFEINPDSNLDFSQFKRDTRADISYELQLTEDGDLYAEVSLEEDLADVFFVYSIVKELISESKK